MPPSILPSIPPTSGIVAYGTEAGQATFGSGRPPASCHPVSPRVLSRAVRGNEEKDERHTGEYQNPIRRDGYRRQQYLAG